MSFGEKLRKLRRERNLTQQQLGEQLSMHGRHISKYESGQVLPGAETLAKIARFLGVSIDYLLFEEAELPAAARINDETLLRDFEAVDRMSQQDKAVIKALIDAYIKKNQLEEILSSR